MNSNLPYTSFFIYFDSCIVTIKKIQWIICGEEVRSLLRSLRRILSRFSDELGIDSLGIRSDQEIKSNIQNCRENHKLNNQL